MHVVALCSHKGGSGKTTLSAHLAVHAERCGAGPVVLVDVDPLGSLATWWNEREVHAPALASTTLAQLPTEIERLRDDGCRLVVIDTPPAISMAIQRAAQAADLVVVPVRPSPHDLRAVAPTVELVERAQRTMMFVLNGANPRARTTADAWAALSAHGPVAPVLVQHRVDFAASMVDGQTVSEVAPHGASAREIGRLWDELAARLEKVGRRRVFRQQPPNQTFGRRASV